MEKKRIKVLIVEDSLTAQNLLKGILASDPGFKVLGIVGNGKQAVEAVSRLNPDVAVGHLHLMTALATRRLWKNAGMSCSSFTNLPIWPCHSDPESRGLNNFPVLRPNILITSKPKLLNTLKMTGISN